MTVVDAARRIQYAKLWRSLIMADVDGIKAASVAMNAGDSYQLFAGMLTNRPWEKVHTNSRSLSPRVRSLHTYRWKPAHAASTVVIQDGWFTAYRLQDLILGYGACLLQRA